MGEARVGTRDQVERPLVLVTCNILQCVLLFFSGDLMMQQWTWRGADLLV